jgi:urease accessory protein
MQQGASQQMEVCLGAGASFSFLPHPSVPHKASHFTAINKIYLESKCQLVWGEVLTCGRNLHGELFTFSKYHSCTEIFMNDRLVIKENLLLQPSRMDISGLGQLEGYTHQASLIYLQEDVNITVLMQDLYEWLLHQDLCFGITALPVNGLMIRILGYKGEQLHNCLLQMAARLPTQHCAYTNITNTKSKLYAE